MQGKAAGGAAPAGGGGGSAADQAAAYEAAIREAGGIGLERICKHCGFKNDSGTARETCEKCGKALPMKDFMRQDEKILYEGLLVELAMQGQQYAQHVWGNYVNEVGRWVSYEPNPCLLNGCPCATKFLKGVKELCGGKIDTAGAKTEFKPCGSCSKQRGQHCDHCLGTGTRPVATWGRLNAQWCWHGTRASDVYCLICHDSLRPDLRAGQAYGAGEYFGVNPTISQGYAAGTNRQLVCWCFDGTLTSGGCVPQFEQKHASDHRGGGMRSAIFNHAPGFCYVLNNPGGRGSLSGREHDRTVMYCIPVGLVTYGNPGEKQGKDPPALNWGKLSCGAAILGARSTWDLPEFTDRLESARRIQVAMQREEQLMWAYMHHEKMFRENIIMNHFKEMWQQWPRSQDDEAKQRWFLDDRERKQWKAVCDGPVADKIKKAQQIQKVAADQRQRQMLEKKLKAQMGVLFKKLQKAQPAELRRMVMGEQNFLVWDVEFVGPRASPFQEFHGLQAQIEFSIYFPGQPPKVRFGQKLFHPNVDGHRLMNYPLASQEKWEETFGEKGQKIEECFRAVVADVSNTMVHPDMLNIADGSDANMYSPDSEGLLEWRKEAAKRHGTEDTMEELSALRAGSDEHTDPVVGRHESGHGLGQARGSTGRSPRTPPEKKARTDRGVSSTFREFVSNLRAENEAFAAAMDKKLLELVGDKEVGDSADYQALVKLAKDHKGSFLKEAEEHNALHEVAFLKQLQEFVDRFAIPLR